MDSTDDAQFPIPLITLTPSLLPLNLSAPLSSPPTVVSPPTLEIISPKPKRFIPNLAAYLEDEASDDEPENDVILPRTESPEPMSEFKVSPSIQSISPFQSNRIISTP